VTIPIGKMSIRNIFVSQGGGQQQGTYEQHQREDWKVHEQYWEESPRILFDHSCQFEGE